MVRPPVDLTPPSIAVNGTSARTGRLVVDTWEIFRNPNTIEGAWLRFQHGAGAEPVEVQDAEKWQRMRARVHTVREATVEPWPTPWPVHVVLLCTGWGPLEDLAVYRLANMLRECPGMTATVVQNLPSAYEECRLRFEQLQGGLEMELRLAQNKGFAAGNNAGRARASRLDRAPDQLWTLYTQADCTFGPGEIRTAMGYSVGSGLERHATVGPSGGKVTWLERGQLAEVGRQMRGTAAEAARVDFVTGFWVLAPTAAVDLVGGWAECFFLYYEDPDLSMRLESIGSPQVVVPALGVDHQRSATIGKLCGEPRREEIRRRSRATFIERWAPEPAEEIG